MNPAGVFRQRDIFLPALSGGNFSQVQFWSDVFPSPFFGGMFFQALVSGLISKARPRLKKALVGLRRTGVVFKGPGWLAKVQSRFQAYKGPRALSKVLDGWQRFRAALKVLAGLKSSRVLFKAQKSWMARKGLRSRSKARWKGECQ